MGKLGTDRRGYKMKKTFENARVGDRVWSVIHRWGRITKIDSDEDYPIEVKFDFEEQIVRNYDHYGKYVKRDPNPSLYWDEIKFKVPKKPLPDLEVDTKVIVWDDGDDDDDRHKRYFSHFNEDGKICCFLDGTTSWTAEEQVTSWDYWELAEKETK
jgi:hypothetical protein